MKERNRIQALVKDRSHLLHAVLAGMAVATLITVVGLATAQAAGNEQNAGGQTGGERYQKIRDAEQADQRAKSQPQTRKDSDHDHRDRKDEARKGKNDGYGYSDDYNKHGKATGTENADQHRPERASENYEAAKDGKVNKGQPAGEDNRGWFSRFFGWGKDRD